MEEVLSTEREEVLVAEQLTEDCDGNWMIRLWFTVVDGVKGGCLAHAVLKKGLQHVYNI